MSKLKEYKLDKLYEMSSGISSKPEQAGHGAPFVSFSAIFNNYFLPDELTDRMDTSDSEQNIYSVKKGDIFLTRTSENLDELAMSCVAIKDYPKATYSGFAKRLRPTQNDITYDKFMGFFLRSTYFRKIIDNNAIMTLRASFNENIFSYIKISLPDYETQKKVGDFLYLLEDKIKLNKKINTELEAMVQTIYDYWFVQFEYPDKKGNPYKSSGGKMLYNNELKCEIPEGWEVIKLNQVFDFVKGKTPVETSAIENLEYISPYLTIEALNEGIYQYCTENQMVTTDGDVLMVMDGAASSDVYVGFKGVIGSTLSKLAIKNNIITNELLYLILKRYESVFKKVNTGSTVPHANKNYINNLSIALPKDDLLKSNLQKLIYALIQKIIYNRRENNKLTDLRNWLIPMLINGQITFKELEQTSNNEALSSDKLIKQAIDQYKNNGNIDIESIARANGMVVYKDLSVKKAEISFNHEKGLWQIAVKEPQDSFSIAHEIAHAVLHHEFVKQAAVARKDEHSLMQEKEREADSLAAEILMPEECVLEYLKDENITNNSSLDKKFVEKSAKKFNVSLPAMNMRLKNLGYKVPYITSN